MHRDLLERRGVWQDVLTHRASHLTDDSFCDGFRAEPFLAMHERLRDMGIEFVLVVMPTVAYDFHGRELIASVRDRITVLECDRPLENRPIASIDAYYDVSHLSTEGARTFSRHLADLLVEVTTKGIGAQASPRYRAEGGIHAKTQLVGNELQIRAHNLPLAGDLHAILSRRGPDIEVAPGLTLRVEFPPLAHCELRRIGIEEATGSIDVESLRGSSPLWIQVGTLRDGKVLDLCEPQPIEFGQVEGRK